jgi:hypothetical protein
VSGAGRKLTRLSDSALRRRATTDAGSSRSASLRSIPTSRPSLSCSSWAESAATASSTASRCSSVRQAVSRAMTVALHSAIRPARQAAQVWGSSVGTTLARPRCWRPRCGDSRRARATIDATPLPLLALRTPAASSSARTEVSSSDARAAWVAVAVQISSSTARIASRRLSSSRPLGASSAADRAACHDWMTVASTAAAASPGGGAGGLGRMTSNMCSMILAVTDIRHRLRPGCGRGDR